jgi:hypothetical protein
MKNSLFYNVPENFASIDNIFSPWEAKIGMSIKISMSADRECKVFTPPQYMALKLLDISKQLNRFWYMSLHLFFSNMKWTVFVAVARKLGNPTSSPGAHFRHQNRSISQWNTQCFCSKFWRYKLSGHLQKTEKIHCIKSIIFCVIYLWILPRKLVTPSYPGVR